MAAFGPIPKNLKQKFWRDDVSERRKALFPFLWSVVAKQGQIFGNQTKGSVARVTNGMAFSYPGYNEMLTGHPDPKIDSNEFGTNPNLTVFEWLNRMPEFHGKVAVYAHLEYLQRYFQRKAQRPGDAGWLGFAGEGKTHAASGIDERAVPDHYPLR